MGRAAGVEWWSNGRNKAGTDFVGGVPFGETGFASRWC